jgi:hypothetical protein
MHLHFLHFLHPDTKYYMKYIVAYNPDDSFEFDFKYFEENKSLKYVNDIKTHYQVKCDGCLAFSIKTTRWKCCNCLFKNMCDGCKNILSDKENQFYDEILYNFKVGGCNPLGHVFMKIIFNFFCIKNLIFIYKLFKMCEIYFCVYLSPRIIDFLTKPLLLLNRLGHFHYRHKYKICWEM